MSVMRAFALAVFGAMACKAALVNASAANFSTVALAPESIVAATRR